MLRVSVRVSGAEPGPKNPCGILHFSSDLKLRFHRVAVHPTYDVGVGERHVVGATTEGKKFSNMGCCTELFSPFFFNLGESFAVTCLG